MCVLHCHRHCHELNLFTVIIICEAAPLFMHAVPTTPVFLRYKLAVVSQQCIQLFGLLVTAGLLSPCMAETFYVTPILPAPADCPQPCYTLNQFTQNQSLLSGHNNITLHDTPGGSSQSQRLPWLTVHTSLIILQPVIPNKGQPPKIISYIENGNCKSLLTIIAPNALIEGLLFENVSLKLGNDGFPDPDVDSSITIKNSTMSHGSPAGVIIGFVQDLLIENSTIFKTSSFGLYITAIPNVRIVNSSISGNSVGIVAIDSNITLRNSEIDSNDFGVLLTVQLLKKDMIGEVDNSCFTRNRFFEILLLTKNGTTIFKNCTFDNNNGTPIIAH